jgi:thiosulfate reductase cytochrome b subunit
MEHWIFKTVLGTLLTTMIGWALISVRNTSMKINKAPTSEDLNKIKKDAFKYTDDQLKIHEDKQILELNNIAYKVDETHKMVGKLLDLQMNKRS